MNEIRPWPASLTDYEHFPSLETRQLPQDISIKISSALSTRDCVGLKRYKALHSCSFLTGLFCTELLVHARV